MQSMPAWYSGLTLVARRRVLAYVATTLVLPGTATAESLSAVMIKSVTNNERLLQTIQKILARIIRSTDHIR